MSTKLADAQRKLDTYEQLLIQAANQLSRRQIAPVLVEKIRVAVNGGGK